MTKHEPHVRMIHKVYDSPEFQALVPNERAILWELIRKYNGFNNGNLSLGVREAAKKCHLGQMAACRALARLQESGLISATYKGHLVPDYGRPNVPTRWRLNFLEESSAKDSLQRFPNDTAGCFRNDTSPPTPDRFRNDTSPPVSFQKQSIDNLTGRRRKKMGAGDGRASARDGSASAGDELGTAGNTPEQSNTGKPNGKYHGTAQHAGCDAIH